MMAAARLFVLLLLACGHALSLSPSTCRDPFRWPFGDSSIWNTAIGSNATYHFANLYYSDNPKDTHGRPTQFHVDQDWALRSDIADPVVVWRDSFSAFPAPNCTQNGCCVANNLPAVSELQLPFQLVTDCVPNNNAAALLLPDNDTLVQFQPFYRGVAGGSFMAWYHQGCPQAFPWNLSIRGDGNLGAHGGSGLSALGGSIRSGELFEEAPPISHALKIELWSHAWYYGQAPLQPATAANGGRVQYHWPATGSDSGSNVVCAKGGLYCGTDPTVAPGSLLAIPPSERSGLLAKLHTVVGRRLLDALIDYGAYLVDDTGSQENGAAICAEPIVQREVLERYNFSLYISDPVTTTQARDLYDDLLVLYRRLHAVTNNGPSSVGGGGSPRRPPPPPFCM